MNKEQVCAFIEDKTLNRHDAALCGMAVGALSEATDNNPEVQALLVLKNMLKEMKAMKPDE